MIEPKYRTFFPRFWAGFIDGLVFLPVAAVNYVAYRDGVPILLRCAWYLASSFGFIAYVVVMHAQYGQTLGKMANHVKVLDISEGKLSARQAFMREIVPIGLTAIEVAYRLPSVMAGASPATPQPEVFGLEFWISFAGGLGWFIAELVTMLTNDKRRAVHDFIARSVVVRSPIPAVALSRGTV